MKNNPNNMELEFSEKQIKFDKILNSLDKFTISFCKILDELKIEYVLISGYVAILFGRSRSSEDIDIFIEKLDYAKFEKLWNKLYENFECLNTTKPKEAYNEYLQNGTSIRFSKKGRFIPNMEVKFATRPTDFYAMENKMKVVLNGIAIYTSILESQIAFKLKLGSDKDIEDAVHLFEVFKDNLDLQKLDKYINENNVRPEAKEHLRQGTK